MEKKIIDFMLGRKAEIRSLAIEVAKAMPEDKSDYKPYPESMTFTDLFLHSIGFECMVCNWVKTGSFGGQSPMPKCLCEAIPLAEKVSAENLETLKAVPAEQWAAIVKLPWGPEVPLFALVNMTNEHEIHHRGQLYTHLRLCGVTPPHYR